MALEFIYVALRRLVMSRYQNCILSQTIGHHFMIVFLI